MESLTIPLAVYRPLSGTSGHGTAPLSFLFSQVCLNQIRLSLTQRGLPDSLALAGSVRMKEDPLNGERSYWLGEGELLFRAKLVIKSMFKHGRWCDMYCAALSKPETVQEPKKITLVHSESAFIALREDLHALNRDLVRRGVELNIIWYDADQVSLMFKNFGAPLAAEDWVALSGQITAKLAKHSYALNFYDYRGRNLKRCTTATDQLKREHVGS